MSGHREAYPLISKRIGIEQWQLLAQALDVPTSGTGPDLQVMVEGKLRELEHDPANVQLVIKEISGGQHKLELHDESGAFLEVSDPGEHSILAPASSCPSLASSRESVSDELTGTELTTKKEVQESLEGEISSLREFSEKQRLTIIEYKCLLSETEERATELACKNQQLTELLADAEARMAKLTVENQQLTESLAGTEEKMTKLVLECEQLKQHSSGSEVETLKRDLQQTKGRVKELWKDMCEQIREFDYALWEKDNELESLRKQLETKSVVSMPVATEHPVLTGHSSGAANVSWSLPSTAVHLHRDTYQTTPVLPQHVTTVVGGLATTSSRLLGQPHMPPTIKSGPSVQVPPSVVLPSVSFHTGIPSCSASFVGTMSGQNVPCSGLHTSTAVTTNPLVTQATLSGNPTLPVSLSDTSAPRHGKAPPIDAFTGEDAEIRFDDWLPMLERAAAWNNWSESETLIQFAGYLRGRALQEWNLMSHTERSTYKSAISGLRTRLDPGNKTLAALDFRHITQRESESVSDFIRRLERTFQLAFGHDPMSTETRDVLLYGKLQDGLRLDLVSKAPAISGAQSYKELCIAAKNEERRLAELKRKKQYTKEFPYHPTNKNNQQQDSSTRKDDKRSKPPRQVRCYVCNSPDHLARDCKATKSESRGKKNWVVRAGDKSTVLSTSNFAKIVDSLFPSIEASVSAVQDTEDTQTTSTPKSVEVQIEGVPIRGIVDTGSDITILSRTAFKEIATACSLKKEQFKPPDRTACTYGHHPLKLDGQIDLQIKFGEKSMCERVYVKLDAPDALLLSENVCCKLNIVTYHPDVQTVLPAIDQSKSKKKKNKKARVSLIQTVRLPAESSALVEVEVKESTDTSYLMLELDQLWHNTLMVNDCLLKNDGSGSAPIIVFNTSLCTQVLEKGTYLGKAAKVNLIQANTGGTDDHHSEEMDDPYDPSVMNVRTLSNEHIHWRKQELRNQVNCSSNSKLLSLAEMDKLLSTLEEYHHIFSIVEGERGETSLVEFNINTGNSTPIKQAARRVPFAAREEIAAQLSKMQEEGVIQPSKSPWASPVVLVRKRDGSLRFCVDYRALNAVTKPEVFPLPRIDDLLDKLGHSKYFSTLDLKSGYWQIRVSTSSQEKTAFVTHRGLYEFCVMPFGVRNAPSVFQRLMQSLLLGLKGDSEEEFVDVYLDDIIVFSKTFSDHLIHLQKVFECLEEANLKLNPQKCRFCCSEVEYLGHIVTPNGFKPNHRNMEAVKNFPVPTTLKELRQFLGLTSHYRRFVKGYSSLAQPLYALTRKDAPYHWTAECESAFNHLKCCLITAPVFVYPDFDRDFVLETDASILGLGAILSQVQDDDRLHPLAYASRSLSKSEKNYPVTELETLAVVWGVTHFRYYLYGHGVTVYTDHAAVKAVLGTPNLTGKHARWWSKVHGSGIGRLEIVHRAGRENCHADALSRQPNLPAPEEEDEALEVQVAKIASNKIPNNIVDLLDKPPTNITDNSDTYGSQQEADSELSPIILYLRDGTLPENGKQAQEVITLSQQFTISDGLLYRLNPKRGELPQIVVPSSLRQQLMDEYHAGILAGHFSGPRLFKMISRRWWWNHMYKDLMDYARSCPQCTIVGRSEKKSIPPLRPIPVDHPFQIVGVDIMELPLTTKGNRYLIVFQDLFTKWPMAYPAPDQKAERIARLLAEEIVPVFGVPEALLSDRGTNLLSILMQDVCRLLGIQKLNTTAHHPQCDGMIERLNRTFKAMLRKQAAKFGAQWDTYLPGALWAYRNMPHSSTGEKPSYLLFGFDCRTPTEAALLPTTSHQPVEISDYREQLVEMLSSTRTMAAKANREAQSRYKRQYDKTATTPRYKVGDWVFVYFPSEETGRLRKLSQPWRGPFRIISRDDPDVTVVKVYFPDDPPLQVHQLRVKSCPMSFPCAYYWYGNKRSKPGRPPKWVENFMKQPKLKITGELTETIPAKKKSVKHKSASKTTSQLSPVTQEDPKRSPYNLRSRQPEHSRSSLINGGDV